jgi:hypothetical protein
MNQETKSVQLKEKTRARKSHANFYILNIYEAETSPYDFNFKKSSKFKHEKVWFMKY